MDREGCRRPRPCHLAPMLPPPPPRACQPLELSWWPLQLQLLCSRPSFHRAACLLAVNTRMHARTHTRKHTQPDPDTQHDALPPSSLLPPAWRQLLLCTRQLCAWVAGALITVIDEPVRSGTTPTWRRPFPHAQSPPSSRVVETLHLHLILFCFSDTVLKEGMGPDQPQRGSLCTRFPAPPHSVLHTGTDRSGCQQVF